MKDTVTTFGNSNGSAVTITERQVHIKGKRYLDLELVKDGKSAGLRRFLSQSAPDHRDVKEQWISDLKATGTTNRVRPDSDKDVHSATHELIRTDHRNRRRDRPTHAGTQTLLKRVVGEVTGKASI